MNNSSNWLQKIKEAKQRAEEQNKERDKARLLIDVKRHENELQNLKESLRKANIQCSLNRQKQHQLERQALLEGGKADDNILKKRTFSTQEEALEVSKGVTSDLKRIKSMLEDAAAHGSEIFKELDESSNNIGGIIQEHGGFAEDLGEGKGLTTRLRRREMTDRLLMGAAVLFFLLVCLYIVKQRLRLTFFGLLG